MTLLNDLLTDKDAETAALIAVLLDHEQRIKALEQVKAQPGNTPIPVSDDFTDPALWTQTFASDFTTLDPKIWRHDFYFGDRVLNSNGERQYYMDADYKGDGKYNVDAVTGLGVSLGIDPFVLGAGKLRIRADVSDPLKSAHYWNYPYVSGLITTEDSFSQTYGRFVASLKLPQGKGLWPAFWLLPVDKSWPPEMDALEFFGAPNANGEGGNSEIHVGMISPTGAESRGAWAAVEADVTAGFHVYAIEVSPALITWSFDGKMVMQATTPAAMNKPFYMICNLAVGGTWPGLPDATTVFPAFLDVGFIRAYQRKP
jgi:beta-glucanase (GH16 family)